MKYKVGVHPFMMFRLTTSELCEEGEYDDNTGDLIVVPGCSNIMQFTGIKDSKGNDIYEGDIVLQWDKFIVIEWDNQSNKQGYNINTECVNLEVKGNIYETPELLK
jgi:hypothetical protein